MNKQHPSNSFTVRVGDDTWGFFSSKRLALSYFDAMSALHPDKQIRLKAAAGRPDEKIELVQSPHPKILFVPLKGKPQMNYAPHQLRVIEEQHELSAKITKLSAWLQTPQFQTVEYWEQRRQYEQLVFMEGYNAVLLKRIAAFKPAG